MNICFASLSYPMNGTASSGVGSAIQVLAQNLVKSGNSISIVGLAENGENSTVEEGGAQIHRISSGKLHWYVTKLPFIGKALALPIREIEYSLAAWRGVRHARQTRKVDLIEGTETGMVLVALFCKGTPLVIRLHGEKYTFHKYTPGLPMTVAIRLSRALQRLALKRATVLISPSQAHANEISQELGFTHNSIQVVPNFIRVDDFPAEISKSRDEFTLLFVGRLERVKGVPVLLEAARKVVDEFPNARIVLAGGSHPTLTKDEIEAMIRSYSLENSIEQRGQLPRQELIKLYHKASICVIPSHYETFSLVALEAMTCGMPVVAARTGALPEVIEDGVTGVLVQPGNPSELAEAIIRLLKNPSERQRMGEAGKLRSRAEFSIERNVALNLRVYEQLHAARGVNKAAAAISQSVKAQENGVHSHWFFSPHLDDVVLSCGGIIHSLISKNSAVRVVTVFAGKPEATSQSAFARHLEAKWGTADPVGERRQEDREAMSALGVKDFEHWDYAEAPYRLAPDRSYLYGTFDELRGSLASLDEDLIENITNRILTSLATLPTTSILYFPLSLGQHVDHQILFKVGLKLSAAGKQVRFYEDFPYAETYHPSREEVNWVPRSVSISAKPKLKAAGAYTTQLRGLGGSVRRLNKRLRAFGSRDGQSATERYWESVAPRSTNGNQNGSGPQLALRQKAPRIQDFNKFLQTFRWHNLPEVLPAGRGSCVDIGCGNGRHRAVIESKGYDWLGVDQANQEGITVRAEANALPVESRSQSAVIAWQVLEYVERPEEVFAEAARVLEPGGVFCGSVSFLEPVHGRTYVNMSPLLLEKRLREYEFADIQLSSGLNGFALMLWTWLRRTGIPFADKLAIPLALALLGPLALLIFSVSWLRWQLGLGTNHAMKWLTAAAPLEFAGHVMFSARKKARKEPCI